MPSKKYEVYVQKGRPWYKIISGILFSHLGLFVLCILYGVIGAMIFIEIERPAEVSRHELKISKTKEVVTAVNYLKKIFWQYANNEKYNFSRTDFREQVHGDLTTLKNFVISYVNDYGYDGTEEWNYDWVFSKSLLFTITIMTTIGYGHISPKTFGGKLFCIGYALVGIPLLLVFMKDIGDLMADGVRWMYSVYGIFKLAFTVIYCIFGIMLISLALNLMQEQVLEKVRWIASEIGMSSNGNDNEEVVKITKGERLKQTPVDMTGNELDFNEKRHKIAEMEQQADGLALGIVPEEP
ncbi:hypothetical protein TCAL_15883 [Tigriopus californicus]|uniref:Potassium channel domain-containing protein n=1 Tax=Tigriopus californicus TaxID=6832 RepID=A0A553NQU0_TIGCA|nr:hypothetical protein TCAL_15883 [Tigriopus californicus]